MKKIITYLILFFLFTKITYADEDAIIRGVADFLIERANQNYLYIFEEKLKKNEFVQKYLPNTFSVLKNTELKQLMLSKILFKESIEDDLINLYKIVIQENPESTFIFNRTFAQKEETILNDIYSNFKKGRLIITSSKEKYIISDIIFQNSSGYYLDEKLTQKISNTQSKFKLEHLPDRIDVIKQRLNNLKNKDNLSLKDLSILLKVNEENKDKFDEVNNNLTHLNKNAKGLIRTINNFLKSLKTDDYLIENIDDLYYTLEQTSKYLLNITKTTDLIIELMNILNEDNINIKSLVLRVNKTLAIIENLNETAKDSKSFRNFKKYAMFFAQIAESEKPEEVKKILEAITLPQNSFFSKRNGEMRLLLSSYLGLAYGYESINNKLSFKNKNIYYGLFAPVGIEFIICTPYRNSFSLLGSIFDFGPAVNAQMLNSKNKLQFKDILAPGVNLNFGFKDLPLTIGIGFFKTRGVLTENNSEKRILFFVGFDIPLFNLY
jgi:hypothetical protein